MKWIEMDDFPHRKAITGVPIFFKRPVEWGQRIFGLGWNAPLPLSKYPEKYTLFNAIHAKAAKRLTIPSLFQFFLQFLCKLHGVKNLRILSWAKIFTMAEDHILDLVHPGTAMIAMESRRHLVSWRSCGCVDSTWFIRFQGTWKQRPYLEVLVLLVRNLGISYLWFGNDLM